MLFSVAFYNEHTLISTASCQLLLAGQPAQSSQPASCAGAVTAGSRLTTAVISHQTLPVMVVFVLHFLQAFQHSPPSLGFLMKQALGTLMDVFFSSDHEG